MGDALRRVQERPSDNRKSTRGKHRANDACPVLDTIGREPIAPLLRASQLVVNDGLELLEGICALQWPAVDNESRRALDSQ
ncbi:MAG: hypothetical protein KatS3mg077_0730 [Candidatus Binatia bacterium]|nr:MAG: hypothetical protein KatS3mg077_0730 [Candidatus Binatia bacterium]